MPHTGLQLAEVQARIVGGDGPRSAQILETHVIEQCDRCLEHLQANRIQEATRIFEEITLNELRFGEEAARMCEIIEAMYLSAWARQR